MGKLRPYAHKWLEITSQYLTQWACHYQVSEFPGQCFLPNAMVFSYTSPLGPLPWGGVRDMLQSRQEQSSKMPREP